MFNFFLLFFGFLGVSKTEWNNLDDWYKFVTRIGLDVMNSELKLYYSTACSSVL